MIRTRHDYESITETSEGWEVTFLEPNLPSWYKTTPIEVSTEELFSFTQWTKGEYHNYIDNDIDYVNDCVIDLATEFYKEMNIAEIKAITPKMGIIEWIVWQIKTYFNV